jgi:hypothetical protein
MPRATVANGYGAAHKRLRRQWASRVAAGGVDCARCGQPIVPGSPWDLDHSDDRSSYLGASHRSCNRSVAGALPRQRPGASDVSRFGGLPDPDPGNMVARWSRHWSGPFNPRCSDCRRLAGACEVAKRFEASEAARVAQ